MNSRAVTDVHGDAIVVGPPDMFGLDNGAVVHLQIRSTENSDEFVWAGNALHLRELIIALEAFERELPEGPA